MVINVPWFLFKLKHWLLQGLMALVKRFHINFNDSPLTGVNTPGSDENRLKL